MTMRHTTLLTALFAGCVLVWWCPQNEYSSLFIGGAPNTRSRNIATTNPGTSRIQPKIAVGYGGGYGGGQGQTNQFSSTFTALIMIGVVLLSAFTLQRTAEKKGWRAPQYEAPRAAPAPPPQDRAAFKEQALKQFMENSARQRGNIEDDRFQNAIARPSIEGIKPDRDSLPNKVQGNSIGLSPTPFRSPLGQEYFLQTAENPLLPQRYQGSAKSVNSLL